MSNEFGNQKRATPIRMVWGLGALMALIMVVAACQPIQPMPGGETSSAGGGEAMMVGNAEAGAYLVALNGCGCHGNRDLGAPAGGNKFEGEYGVVYASNLTPDKETGLGNWSEEQIANALLNGSTPDGQLAPAMPYAFFSTIFSQQDAYDIAAHLLSQHALANPLPANELVAEIPAFTPEAEATVPTEGADRGKWVATLTGCARCHTPAKEDGSANQDLMLAGGRPIGEEIAKNITPDEATGIGSWTEEQIAKYMKTGERPDGTIVAGAMGTQIKNRFSKLTDADAAAVAAYLKSVPAVENKIGE